MRIEKEKLLSLITDKTKAIILNSPCNPTGKLMTESDLACIYECIKDRPIFVISDEIYRELLFDNQAVSYTHLDVYKRQVQLVLIISHFY